MAVSFRLTAAPTFPQGSTVNAYLQREWSGLVPRPGEGPRSAVAAVSGAVDSHGFATFASLEGATAYYAGAEVAGVWQWRSIITQADTVSGSGVTLSEMTTAIGALKAELVALITGKLGIIEALEAKTVTGPVTLPEAVTAQLFVLTMKASATITLPKPVAGTSFTAVTIQDSGGSRAVTWHSPTGAVRWPEGSVASATSLAGAIDIWNFVCWDGANWDAAVPMLNLK